MLYSVGLYKTRVVANLMDFLFVDFNLLAFCPIIAQSNMIWDPLDWPKPDRINHNLTGLEQI